MVQREYKEFRHINQAEKEKPNIQAISEVEIKKIEKPIKSKAKGSPRLPNSQRAVLWVLQNIALRFALQNIASRYLIL